MKTFSLCVGIWALLPGLILASDLEKRDCAPNNCLRQVEATRPAAQLHMASSDCSSYLADSTTTVTVTPGLGRTITAATTTKTVKVTTTKYATATSKVIQLSVSFVASVSTVIVPGKRAASKTIPTYASACTAPGQYASACSCYGIGPAVTKTSTAHSVAPMTITKTITTTVSSVISATKTTIETSTSTRVRVVQQTETIPASSFFLSAAGAPFDGEFLETDPDTDTLFSTILIDDGDPFILPSYLTLSKGNLYQGDFVAVASADDFYGLSFQSGKAKNDPTRLVCAVGAAGTLNCQTSEGLNTFYGCLDESGEEFPPAVYFYPPDSESTVPFGCSPITFTPHYAT